MGPPPPATPRGREPPPPAALRPSPSAKSPGSSRGSRAAQSRPALPSPRAALHLLLPQPHARCRWAARTPPGLWRCATRVCPGTASPASPQTPAAAASASARPGWSPPSAPLAPVSRYAVPSSSVPAFLSRNQSKGAAQPNRVMHKYTTQCITMQSTFQRFLPSFRIPHGSKAPSVSQ